MGYAYQESYGFSHAQHTFQNPLPEAVAEYQTVLLESIHEAIIATDGRGLISYWNPLAEQLFGLSAWAALDRPAVQVFSQAMDRNDILDMIHALMRDGCFTGEIDDFEINGRKVCLDVHASLIPGKARHEGHAGHAGYASHAGHAGHANHAGLARHAGEAGVPDERRSLHHACHLRRPEQASQLGRARGVVISIRDVTHCKEAERLLLEGRIRAVRLARRLQQEDQRKTHFLNIISHELRNPLAAIAMGQSLLKHLQPDEAMARKTVDMMERQTMLLTRLVDDLLDASRIVANKISLRTSPLDLNAFVAKVIDDHQLMFAEKGVSLVADLSPDPITVQADPFRLTQILGNLLHNAWKFTESGGSVCLATRANADSPQEPAPEALVIVKDTGIGIEPDKLDTLFRPFTQIGSAPERVHGGLGLGLSIAKGLVALHGGRLCVESGGIGQGTQFTVHLPVPVLDTRVQDAG